ncbi:mapk-regulated corepressor-interacting protein 1-like [Clavelina lepadiformis]|uniref:Uncharacterized protein n=1 Tax=Clavelina lepadiformis TaxID=159417 RepID=A0ABP0FUZ3_CLALP
MLTMLSISGGKQAQNNQHKLKSSAQGLRRDKLSPSEKEAHWGVNNMGSHKVHFNSASKHIPRGSTTMNYVTDPITSQHKDNVSSISEEWDKVKADLNKREDERILGTTQYIEKNPHPSMQNFRPFDLEDFWGQKQLSNLT